MFGFLSIILFVLQICQICFHDYLDKNRLQTKQLLQLNGVGPSSSLLGAGAAQALIPLLSDSEGDGSDDQGMVAQQDDSDAASASSLLGPKDVKRGKTPATSLHNVADRKKANNITCIYCWSRKTLTDM